MALTRLCLDTSAYSRFMRSDEAAVTVIATARWIGLPAVVLGELHTGFALGSRRQQNLDELASFLTHPVVEMLPVDERAAQIYADIVVDLRRAGTPVPTNDIWIAATAAAHTAPVLTADHHFHHIARVAVAFLE